MLLIILIVLLILCLGSGGYAYAGDNYPLGHGSIGLGGLLLIILIVLLLSGRL